MNSIDGETAVEQRANAAHMLVVPYDATPDVAHAAYRRRLVSRLDMQNDDADSLNTFMNQIHDANVIMSYPAGQHWRAKLKLTFATAADKMIKNYVEYTNAKLDEDAEEEYDLGSILVLDLLNHEFKKMGTTYKVLKTSIGFQLVPFGAMVWNMFANAGASPTFYIAAGATSVALGALSGIMSHRMNNHMQNIEIMSTDTFRNQLVDEITKTFTKRER